MTPRRVGVEEELLLVAPDDGLPLAVADAVLRLADEPPDDGQPGGSLDNELQREQIETDTVPCTTVDELATELRSWRRRASAAAQQAGVDIAAVGTSPVIVDPNVTHKTRYLHLVEEFGLTAQEQLVSGCHVHVELTSPDEGVAVLDRIRTWLPVVLALSVNSPFWQGSDTGHASFRSQVVARWPSGGMPDTFTSAAEYRRTMRSMLDSGVLLDEGMVYFDIRLSRAYPTVEIRIADVCLRVDDTVLVAALTRALVETEAASWARGEPYEPDRVELLRLAKWRAARSGLSGDLCDPRTGKPAPARSVVAALVSHVTPVLEEQGELPLVEELLSDLYARGPGADTQRAVMARTASPAAVMREVVRQTTLF